MDPQNPPQEAKPGVSKVKLAVGAASLFLFIVGLKRTFSMDDSRGGPPLEDELEEAPRRPERPGGRRS